MNNFYVYEITFQYLQEAFGLKQGKTIVVTQGSPEIIRAMEKAQSRFIDAVFKEIVSGIDIESFKIISAQLLAVDDGKVQWGVE